MRRAAGILLTALILAAAGNITAATPARAYTPSPATVAAYEARVAWRINRIRHSYGRGYVAPSYCPDRYAEAWAGYLARTGSFYHRPMTAILAGCRASVASENLGRGNVSADTLAYAWMASPSHRAVLLDGRLTRIGVAAVYAGGHWTVVADFVRP